MRGKTARELTESETHDIAVRYLTRREYGMEELRKKLIQRGSDPAMAEKVVADLADENLVSDQRFIEMYVRTRTRRLFGPLKIRGELRSLGVSDSLIGEAMPVEQETWFDSASQWAEKRCHGELDYAGRAKIHRSLMNRGFTHEQANVALDRLNSSD
ncbi:MAG: regulatory protein RecX [Lysobacterales bacterium]